MQLDNNNFKFLIPSLENEWVFPAKLCYNELENSFSISKQSNDFRCKLICKMNIIHTIIGNINSFLIICRNFDKNDFVFECILEPIFRRYCELHLIELKFEYLDYD
jgi:hypothetical protein